MDGILGIGFVFLIIAMVWGVMEERQGKKGPGQPSEALALGALAVIFIAGLVKALENAGKPHAPLESPAWVEAFSQWLEWMVGLDGDVLMGLIIIVLGNACLLGFVYFLSWRIGRCAKAENSRS